MIVERTFEQPSDRDGYLCQGKVTTDAGGQALITVKGVNLTSKVTGITFGVKSNSGEVITVVVTDITYDSSSRLNTISILASYNISSSVLRESIVDALDAIVASNPADISALLPEITAAALSIGSAPVELTPFEGTVYYSFWIDAEPNLPADQSTNNTEEQEY